MINGGTTVTKLASPTPESNLGQESYDCGRNSSNRWRLAISSDSIGSDTPESHKYEMTLSSHNDLKQHIATAYFPSHCGVISDPSQIFQECVHWMRTPNILARSCIFSDTLFRQTLTRRSTRATRFSSPFHAPVETCCYPNVTYSHGDMVAASHVCYNCTPTAPATCATSAASARVVLEHSKEANSK